MPAIAVNPIAAARIASKTPIGSPLGSAELAQLPQGLRDSAQFSAHVENLRLMQRVQDRVEQVIGQLRNERGVYVNEAQFVAEMQKIAREEGLDPRNAAETADRFGGIQDITSERRLKLIYRVQVQMANEYARWVKANDPAVLQAWPAQEFIRVQSRKVPRTNWPERFQAAGGKLINDRMVALISDPLWRKLSVFGNPYPPFDYGSGMGLRTLSRREAEALRLLKPGDVVKSSFEEFNAHLKASVTDLNETWQNGLKDIFGDQIQIVDGVASWVSQSAAPAAAPVASPVSRAVQLSVANEEEAARFRTGLAAIDGVHGDGPLQPLPFNHRVGQDMIGSYYSKKNINQAISIGVKAGIEDTEFGLVHEVGHWLDHIGIPSTTKFASEGAPELRGLLQALRQSQAYQRVVAGQNLSVDYQKYLSLPEEFFARAYAQFIAEESKNPALLGSLEKIVSGKFRGMPAISQWETADFAPIRAAMRELFVRLGWMPGA